MNAITASSEVDRVRKHTAKETLCEIDRQIEANVRFYAMQPESAVTARIAELDREWSMERWLETNASALAFTGVVLGLSVSKKWFALPLIVTGFLFQHAVQGWCPPVPVLRALGVRTRGEIDRERFALKTLRGDFGKSEINVSAESAPRRILQAIAAA